MLLSNHEAAKFVFKKVSCMDLSGGGWIYTDGSEPVGMAACIPHDLFTCSTADVSEIIFLCAFHYLRKDFKSVVHVHLCVLGVEVNAAHDFVPINQNIWKKKYSHTSLDTVFFFFSRCCVSFHLYYIHLYYIHLFIPINVIFICP